MPSHRGFGTPRLFRESDAFRVDSDLIPASGSMTMGFDFMLHPFAARGDWMDSSDRRRIGAERVERWTRVPSRGDGSRRASEARARAAVGLVLAGLLLSGAGCADAVSRRDLLAQIEAGSAPRIVDVRSRSEYEAAHVPGAVHVPFASMLFHLDALPADEAEADGEEAPLILYCEHGPRAGLARAQLWMAGVGPVLFMEGHMTAWKSDGLPVERGGAPTSSSSVAAPGSEDEAE